MEKETVSVTEILKRLENKVQVITDAILNNNVNLLRDEAASSLICGDEVINDDSKVPVLDGHLSFKYKGFDCELSSCNAVINIGQLIGLNDRNAVHERFPNGIFTDRYVCWLWGTRDSDGYTLSEYLEHHPDESIDRHYWSPEVHLVPKAWAWGAESDLKPGETVEKIILTGIDEFLKENPNI